MTRNNALWNCLNPHQGKYKRVLTLCSAGLLRSPTMARYLESVSNYNCRSAGVHDYALIQVDDVLIKWAELILCADVNIYNQLIYMFPEITEEKSIVTLDIPDIYEYRNPDLLKLIEEQCIRQSIFKDKTDE